MESYLTQRATNRYQTPEGGSLPGNGGGQFVFRSPLGASGHAVTAEWSPKIAVKRSDTDQLSLAKALLKASRFSDALPLFQQSASSGNPEGLLYMGKLYENGWGVKQNDVQAFGWYEKGAAAGSGSAMTTLGALYEGGRGVPRDYERARQWYERGVAAGDANAMTNLGSLYERGLGVPQDHAQAREWYKKAVAAGDTVFAQASLDALSVKENSAFPFK